MVKENYKDFMVFKNDDKNIFIHIKLDCDSFYEDLISFFFQEEKLLGYIANKTTVEFDTTIQQFVSLFKTLSSFIDDENLEIDIEKLKIELKKYIDWEKYSNDELLKLRRDKIGKIGEYILHHILSDYFKLTCILPKLVLNTNKNMSVFGIDVIFFDDKKEMLLFGESKVSKTLDNGINLINKSLTNYEHQICEEYRTILSSELINKNLPEEINGYIGKALSFKKFIEIANIKRVGIPIFIMSGEDIELETINKKLDKIDKIDFMGLEIIYYIINLPIVDKNVFQSKIIKFLRERCDYYESKCQ